MPRVGLGSVVRVGENGGMRPGTTIVLGILLALILGASILQMFVLAR